MIFSFFLILLSNVLETIQKEKCEIYINLADECRTVVWLVVNKQMIIDYDGNYRLIILLKKKTKAKKGTVNRQ